MLWFLLSFKGRASRQTYWLAILFLTFVYSAFAMPIVRQLMAGTTVEQSEPMFVVAEIVFLAIFWSNIAVAMKRLHDMGMSGVIALGVLIPVVNLILTVWIGIAKGQQGPNKYGPAPDMPAN